MAIKDKVNRYLNRRLVSALVAAIAIPTVLLAYYFFLQFSPGNNNDADIQLREKLTKVFHKAGIILKQRWEMGDFENKRSRVGFSCPLELGDSGKYHSNYLRCNPNYLQCFLEGNAGYFDPSLKIMFGNEEIKVIARPLFLSPARYGKGNRFYKIISKVEGDGGGAIDYGVVINLFAPAYPDWSMDIILEDSCSDVYLPQRRYLFGRKKEEKRGAVQGANPFLRDAFNPKLGGDYWRWDNYGSDIYVDRFQVTYRDVIEWLDYSANSIKLKLPNDSALWWMPASGLSIEQMERYCAFRGKQLMQAHVYDAATYFVGDSQKPFSKDVFPTSYHWGKRSTDSFLFKSHKGDKNVIISKNDCQNAYVQECASIYQWDLINYSPESWMGVGNILGGYLEVMINPLDPPMNLFASSIYFPAKSAWHLLGKRAQWNGEDFDEKSFNWIDPIDQKDDSAVKKASDDFLVGFRCMKLTEGEK